jgi:uncharacterized protein (TIGR02246 family)
MRNAMTFVLLLSLSSASAALDNVSARAKARQEVQALLGRMAMAEKTGDALALAQCYDKDGILLPSSGEPVKGRDEIAKRYQAIFTGKTPRLPLESEELWVLDDVAVSRGVTRAPSTRKNVKGAIRNRYVMTLKRSGDSWEIDTLVWNPTVAARKREEE